MPVYARKDSMRATAPVCHAHPDVPLVHQPPTVRDVPLFLLPIPTELAHAHRVTSLQLSPSDIARDAMTSASTAPTVPHAPCVSLDSQPPPTANVSAPEAHMSMPNFSVSPVSETVKFVPTQHLVLFAHPHSFHRMQLV